MFTFVTTEFDKGDYSFSGKALIDRNVALMLSQTEIDSIIETVRAYTKSQTRDYVLRFENKEGIIVLVVDNISNSDKEEFKAQGYPTDEIASHDYFTLTLGHWEV